MSKNVFIVEDDHACETILNRTIRSIDPSAHVEWEESAEQAILALEKDSANGKKYDLIIADIFLSGKYTGLELWEACQGKYPDTPILIISSLPVNLFLDRIGRRAIAPPFLPKPFHVGECRQIIEGLLAYG